MRDKKLISVIESKDTTLNYLKNNHFPEEDYTLKRITIKNNSIDNLAKSVKDSDVVFINIAEHYEGSLKADLKGIEIIYWLRLKHQFKGKIITYSMLSSDHVIELNAKHVVIHAPGNKYWRLLDEFPILKYRELTKKEISEGYIKYIIPFNSENNLRHSDANKWAIWKYTNILNSIITSKKNTIPQRIIIGKPIYNKECINHLIASKVYNVIQKEHDDQLTIDILNLRKEIEGKNILLVDDMAEDGWNDLFQRLFNCKENEYHYINNVRKLRLNKIYKLIIDKVKEDGVNLILLDLRLHDEKGTLNIEDLSGFKILKELKKVIPEIPIIIVTASNKIRTSKALATAGVYGTWVKEGIDNSVSNIDLYLSFYALLEMVNSAYKTFKDEGDRLLYGLDYRITEKKYLDEPKGFEDLQISSNEKSTMNLSDIDVFILDTNCFVSSAEDDEYFIKKILMLDRLSDYIRKTGKEMVIHNHTFSELRKHAIPMNFNDKESFLTKSAKYSLDKIQILTDEGVLTIADYRKNTYAFQAYADPLILDYILDVVLGATNDGGRTVYSEKTAKNVMLISDDRNLLTKARSIYSQHKKLVITQFANQFYRQLFQKK